jgi:hypothetical protein
VHRLRVRVGQVQVIQHHRQAAVAEHPLQREDIPAVAQVLDGEGVSEAMRVYVVDAAPFFQCHSWMARILEGLFFGVENYNRQPSTGDARRCALATSFVAILR